jgi:hypothetical protein
MGYFSFYYAAWSSLTISLATAATWIIGIVRDNLAKTYIYIIDQSLT